MTDFCVLLPVYIGDRAEYFERALQSVTVDQTLRPSQLIVVCDGPVSPEVDALLDRAVSTPEATVGGVSVEVVRLEQNSGLTVALNRGLEACGCDIVARADADDISLPSRFAEEVPLVEDSYDIVGCAVAEFGDDESVTGLVRRMPRTTAQIRAVADFRDPFNHPTVVYRASAVRAAGGYQELAHMEDYWLFVRMIAAGQRGTNLEDALVLYRVGAGAYRRRGGMQMLRSELELQNRMRRRGYTTRMRFVRNVAIRGGYRLVPTTLRQIAYRTVGRLNWFRAT